MPPNSPSIRLRFLSSIPFQNVHRPGARGGPSGGARGLANHVTRDEAETRQQRVGRSVHEQSSTVPYTASHRHLFKPTAKKTNAWGRRDHKRLPHGSEQEKTGEAPQPSLSRSDRCVDDRSVKAGMFGGPSARQPKRNWHLKGKFDTHRTVE
jgi:hypothetical protein